MEIPGYKILEPLGKGGMAQVYLALQESVGRKVAIKVMNAALTPDPQFIERFIAEARCANLSHPNIITVFDAGQSGNQPFIVMEYIEGGDLAKRLRQGALSPAQALSVIRQVAGALHTSHQKGYVHRDVKPENVLFRDDKTVVLADFGIAKALQSHGSMTQTGMIIGSPSYMSPEQVKGEELDGRADLYSLGVMFYQLLTGNKPYHAEDTYALGYKHINEPIPTLPAALKIFQPMLNSMMAKQKTERVASGQELIKRIDVLASSLTPQQVGYPVAAQKEYPFNLALASANISFSPAEDESDKTQIKAAVPAHATSETRAAAPAKAKIEPYQSKAGLVLGIAAVVIAAAGGGFWYSQRSTPAIDTSSVNSQPVETAPISTEPLINTSANNQPTPTSASQITSAPEDTTPAENAKIETPASNVTPPVAEESKPVVTSVEETKSVVIDSKPVQQEAIPPVVAPPALTLEKPAVEKPPIKENKPAPDPKQLALAQALKKAKSCLQSKDFLCAENESNKALAVDASNVSAKSLLQQAKDGQSSAKKSFIIE